MLCAKASAHAARLGFREMARFGRALPRRSGVRFRRIVWFSGTLSVRLRASSSKVRSGTPCRQVRLAGCARTAIATRSGGRRAAARQQRVVLVLAPPIWRVLVTPARVARPGPRGSSLRRRPGNRRASPELTRRLRISIPPRSASAVCQGVRVCAGSATRSATRRAIAGGVAVQRNTTVAAPPEPPTDPVVAGQTILEARKFPQQKAPVVGQPGKINASLRPADRSRQRSHRNIRHLPPLRSPRTRISNRP